MRLAPVALVSLGLALACGGSETGAPAAGAAKPTAPEATAATAGAPVAAKAAPRANPAALAALGSPADAALADHWLVILASERDPATPVAAAEALRARPDRAAGVRQLNSGRFKNLMPCFAITVADATADKAAALALSAELKAGGIDNYVKNAGAWVGASAAVDAYCGAPVSAFAGGVDVLAVVGDRLWLPVNAPESVVTNALRGAPAPEALNASFDAWRQPVSLDTVGIVAKGGTWRAVDAATGTTRTCKVEDFAALTLGVPHFGALENGPPKRPACGEAKLFAALACDGPVGPGTWVATGVGAPLVGYTPAGEGTPAEVEAATAALTRDTDWEAAPGDAPGDAITREVTVRHWKGPDGTYALVEGTRSVGEGVCGGDEQVWAGLFRTSGGALGEPVGGFVPAAFAHVVGVVDARGDGRPELVTDSFPTTTSVTAVDGAVVSSFTTDFCDCPC